MSRFIVVARRLAGALLLVVLAARDGSAQLAQTPRAFPALFGPTAAELNRPRRLDLSCSIYDAADDNASATDVLDPALQSTRWYTGADVSLAYRTAGRHNRASLNVSSAGRYYPDQRAVVPMRDTGALSVDLQPARAWRLQLSGTASYSPFYDMVLGPGRALWSGDTPPASEDTAVAKQHAMEYASFVGLSHEFGPRTSLAFNSGMRYRQIFGAAGAASTAGATGDAQAERAGFQFAHGITKDIGLRIGYTYGITTTGDPVARPIRNNDLDLGLSYGKTFAPSVRTSLSFSTGSTMVSADGGQHFRVTGSGRLMHRLSPTWTAGVAYDRGLQVPDGATRPFFSDTFNGTLGGYVGRRVNVRLQPSYSHGVVGLSGEVNPYNAYSSTARVDVALGRRVALYAEQFFYRYRFASGAGLPALMMAAVDRQGARVGLTLWAPLLR